MKLKYAVMRMTAIIVLSISYTITVLLSKILKRTKMRKRISNRILVIATFHNPNWFYSHIEPLALSGIREVVLVCDHPIGRINGVRYYCPSKLLSAIFSRAGAKFLWAIICGFKYKPDLYIGYHIFPAGISALIIARIFNRPACYQVTSGPLELEGGG